MSNLHPTCLEWIQSSVQKMENELAQKRRQHKKIDTESMLHFFTMTGVHLPGECEEDAKSEVLLSLSENQGEFNRLFWDKLHSAGLLPFLRSAAMHDLTTESDQPGFGIVARKDWMQEVLESFLVETPDEKWFGK